MRSTSPHRGWVMAAALVVGLALVGAGCGSSSKSAKSTTAGAGATSSTASPSTSGAAATSASTADVTVVDTSLGKVLVGKNGKTLYLFKHDTGTTSACTGACATAWPAVVVTTTPTAGSGVTAALTTATAADGSKQLVVNGHLVYNYAGDQPGDTMGNGVGGVWYALTPAGAQVGG
jgi:predicted lipoprotein with Yx(FWY)xxD motif